MREGGPGAPRRALDRRLERALRSFLDVAVEYGSVPDLVDALRRAAPPELMASFGPEFEAMMAPFLGTTASSNRDPDA